MAKFARAVHRHRLAAWVLLLTTAGATLALAGTSLGATMEVHLKDAEFHPATVSASAGDTVLFINDDPFAHDILFEAGFGTGASGTLAAGANWSHTFDTNGTYRYRCQVHSNDFQFGMVGSVVVGPPAAPRPRAPGFELLAAVCAVGVGAFLMRRKAIA